MAEERVNLAEFKRRMGDYMRRVRRGGTVILVDRKDPVARLDRLDAGAPRVRAIPPKQAGEVFTPVTRVRVQGEGTSQEALRADRDERDLG